MNVETIENPFDNLKLKAEHFLTTMRFAFIQLKVAIAYRDNFEIDQALSFMARTLQEAHHMLPSLLMPEFLEDTLEVLNNIIAYLKIDEARADFYPRNEESALSRVVEALYNESLWLKVQCAQKCFDGLRLSREETPALLARYRKLAGDLNACMKITPSSKYYFKAKMLVFKARCLAGKEKIDLDGQKNGEFKAFIYALNQCFSTNDLIELFSATTPEMKGLKQIFDEFLKSAAISVSIDIPSGKLDEDSRGLLLGKVLLKAFEEENFENFYPEEHDDKSEKTAEENIVSYIETLQSIYQLYKYEQPQSNFVAKYRDILVRQAFWLIENRRHGMIFTISSLLKELLPDDARRIDIGLAFLASVTKKPQIKIGDKEENILVAALYEMLSAITPEKDEKLPIFSVEQKQRFCDLLNICVKHLLPEKIASKLISINTDNIVKQAFVLLQAIFAWQTAIPLLKQEMSSSADSASASQSGLFSQNRTGRGFDYHVRQMKRFLGQFLNELNQLSNEVGDNSVAISRLYDTYFAKIADFIQTLTKYEDKKYSFFPEYIRMSVLLQQLSIMLSIETPAADTLVKYSVLSPRAGG